MIVDWKDPYCKITWTKEELEELYTNVFGRPPRVSQDEGREHPIPGQTDKDVQ